MKKILMLACLGLAVQLARTQESNGVEQLKLQLKQMQENFEKVQREQKEQIDALSRKLDELTKPQASRTETATNITAEAEKKKLEEELAVELQQGSTNATPQKGENASATSSWSAAQPLTVARAGQAY